jgi:hypothetical protein
LALYVFWFVDTGDTSISLQPDDGQEFPKDFFGTGFFIIIFLSLESHFPAAAVSSCPVGSVKPFPEFMKSSIFHQET